MGAAGPKRGARGAWESGPGRRARQRDGADRHEQDDRRAAARAGIGRGVRAGPEPGPEPGPRDGIPGEAAGSGRGLWRGLGRGRAPRGTRRALLGGIAAAGLAAAAPGRALAQGFRIGAGDQLRIEVLEDPSLNRTVLVLPDGSIDFPLAGTLRAAGRTVDELRAALTQALQENFAAPPTVFVSVGALRPPTEVPEAPEVETPTIDVFVTGEVASPGRKIVPPGTTILQIVAEAGGLTRFAAEGRIQLRRTDPRTGAVTTYLYDYDAVGRRPSIRGGTPLAPGDVVVVPERRLFEF